MIILGKYEELSPGMGFPSIMDALEKEPYPNKEIILQYLHSGHVYLVTASRFNDIFTGQSARRELYCMTDGKYSWSSTIPYYVEHYNLRLQKDFEEHVLANSRTALNTQEEV